MNEPLPEKWRQAKASMLRASEAMYALHERLRENGLDWASLVNAGLGLAVLDAQQDGTISEEDLIRALKEWWRVHSSVAEEPDADPPPRPVMSEEEQAELVRQVEHVRVRVTPIVAELHASGAPHEAICMALIYLASHHCLHDGGELPDLFAVVDAAWHRCLEHHKQECVS